MGKLVIITLAVIALTADVAELIMTARGHSMSIPLQVNFIGQAAAFLVVALLLASALVKRRR